MAQVSFETAKALEESRSQSGGDYDFFNLKNDGDEAIVRILHDTTASFPIFTLHQITVGGKRRKISCVRDPRAPLHECPLCDSGNKVFNTFFIQMIVYSQNAEGKMVGRPAIWERSLSYATRLKSMLDEYGPLSECLFKIKRSGAAGSLDTKYEMFFCNPKVYRDDIYAPVPDAFKDVSLEGTLIMNKSAEDMQVFVETGAFPAAAPANNGAVEQSQNSAASSNYEATAPEYVAKEQSVASVAPVRSAVPEATATSAPPARPNRYY